MDGKRNAGSRRGFVVGNTRLQRVPFLPEVRLWLADELEPIWRMTQRELGGTDVAPPFWAFVWPGGQAVARYVLDHPAEVAGKRVVDLGSGSGLCAIAAIRAGAASALAADVEPFCEEAVALNAEANGVRVAFTGHDLLEADPPETDVILAGDVCYERRLAERVLGWLEIADARGVRVLMGDPGRPYFVGEGFIRLAEYEVPTTRELEDGNVKRTGVFDFSS